MGRLCRKPALQRAFKPNSNSEPTYKPLTPDPKLNPFLLSLNLNPLIPGKKVKKKSKGGPAAEVTESPS